MGKEKNVSMSRGRGVVVITIGLSLLHPFISYSLMHARQPDKEQEDVSREKIQQASYRHKIFCGCAVVLALCGSLYVARSFHRKPLHNNLDNNHTPPPPTGD